MIDGIILFIYGVVPAIQPSNFDRVYLASRRIFVVMAIIWDLIVDKNRPDRFKIVGGAIRCTSNFFTLLVSDRLIWIYYSKKKSGLNKCY